MSENLQPTCNELATDTISRQAAIEAVQNIECDRCGAFGEDNICWDEQCPYWIAEQAVRDVKPILPQMEATGTFPEYGTGTAPRIPVYSYPVVYLADECIEKIAEAVARKLRGERK